MDTYLKFNKYIHDYFFNENTIGDSIIMSVDYSVIDEFCRQNKISVEIFNRAINSKLRLDWQFARTTGRVTPKSFGLIAIQIFIASEMHAEEDISSTNYNKRLIKYLSLYDDNNLQKLYREYQDEIWAEVKIWASRNDFTVSIPKAGSYKGRYVQYPLSQALLNKQDLLRFTILFKNIGIRPYEDISFKDFKLLIEGADYGLNVTTHYLKIKDRLILEGKVELLFNQLFSFYNKWDGSILDEKTKSITKQASIEKRYSSLILDSNITTIEILDNDNNIVKEISLKKSGFFKQIKPHYRQFNTSGKYNGIIVLVKDEAYDEWHDSRYLETDKSCILIMAHSHDLKSYIKNLDPNRKNHSKSHIAIFEVNITNEQLKNSVIWQDLFSKQTKPYTIKGGLKLSRQVWMFGAGPIIKFNKETDVWLNGKKIDLALNNHTLSLVDQKIGSYIIKVKGQSPVTIKIEEPKQQIADIKGGWIIDKEDKIYSNTSTDYNINGYFSNFKDEINSSYNIRSWASDLIQKSNKKTNSSSILSQAIKRANHGI